MAADDIRVATALSFVCPTCWLVFPVAGPACAGCGTAAPPAGWPTLPYEFRQRYLFVEQLGRGGMGAVFRAFDRQSPAQPWVAVKVAQLKGDAAARRALEDCFRSEGRAAGMLSQHAEHFVGFRGSDFSEPACLILDFVEWPTLESLRRGASLSPIDVARIGVEVLRGVRFMERRRMVHRDLKPENIFVRRREDGGFDAKIADLGVWVDSGEAYDTTLLGRAGAGLAGTAQYMSPEQTRGEVLTTASDLHTVGSILWELSTGAVPFPFRPTPDVMAGLGNRLDRMRHLPEKPLRMPEDLYEVLGAALRFEPGERLHPDLDSAGGADASLARRMEKALERFAVEHAARAERERQELLAGIASLEEILSAVEDKLSPATRLTEQAPALRARLHVIRQDTALLDSARDGLASLTADVHRLETETQQLFEDRTSKTQLEQAWAEAEGHRARAEVEAKRAADAEKVAQEKLAQEKRARETPPRPGRSMGTVAAAAALAGACLGALLLWFATASLSGAGTDVTPPASAGTAGVTAATAVIASNDPAPAMSGSPVGSAAASGSAAGSAAASAAAPQPTSSQASIGGKPTSAPGPSGANSAGSPPVTPATAGSAPAAGNKPSSTSDIGTKPPPQKTARPGDTARSL